MQLYVWRTEVQFYEVFVRMPHSHASVLLSIKIGEDQLPEPIHDLGLMFAIRAIDDASNANTNFTRKLS